MKPHRKFAMPHRVLKSNLISLAESKYGTQIQRVTYRGINDRYVLADQVIYHTDKILPKQKLIRLIEDESGVIITEDQIEECCWDKTLILITSREYYQYKLNVEKINCNGNNGLNELQYADAVDPLVFDTAEGEPDVNEKEEGGYSITDDTEGEPDVSEKEGTIQIGAFSNTDPIPCIDQLDSGNNTDRRIQVGIVDFGFEDMHAKIIDYIIKGEFDEQNREDVIVQTHDYNVLASFNVANSMAICCQIARGINECMDILNISMGYYGNVGNELILKYLRKAEEAGLLVVFSAGNSYRNVGIDKHWSSNYAAYKSLTNVWAVGALRHENNELAGYSNFGCHNLVTVYSNGRVVLPGYIHHNDMTTGNRIRFAFGTSFATPRVVRRIATLFRANGKASYFTNNEFNKQKILAELNPVAGGPVINNDQAVICNDLSFLV